MFSDDVAICCYQKWAQKNFYTFKILWMNFWSEQEKIQLSLKFVIIIKSIDLHDLKNEKLISKQLHLKRSIIKSFIILIYFFLFVIYLGTCIHFLLCKHIFAVSVTTYCLKSFMYIKTLHQLSIIVWSIIVYL